MALYLEMVNGKTENDPLSIPRMLLDLGLQWETQKGAHFQNCFPYGHLSCLSTLSPASCYLSADLCALGSSPDLLMHLPCPCTQIAAQMVIGSFSCNICICKLAQALLLAYLRMKLQHRAMKILSP